MAAIENPERTEETEIENCPKCGSSLFEEDGKLKCSFILCGFEMDLPPETDDNADTAL